MTRRMDLSILEEFVSSVFIAIRNEEPLDEISKSIKSNIIKKLSSEWNNVDASKLLDLARSIQENVIDGLVKMGFTVARVKAELRSKGLVGISSGSFKTIFEVGLNIDPIIGLPYYPASSIKGLVRSAFEKHYSEEFRDEELESIEKFLFGVEGSEETGIGILKFFDAYPIGCSKRVKNCSVYTGAVVTPHYYKGGEVVDTELDAMPIPVVHLAISPGLVYEFIIAAMEGEILEAIQKDSVFKEYIEALRETSKNGCGNLSKLVLKEIMKILMKELRSGGFARGSKGYNVFEPQDELLDDLRGKVRFFSITIE